MLVISSLFLLLQQFLILSRGFCVYADEAFVFQASHYVAACVAEPSCSLEANPKADTGSSATRKEMLGLKGGFALAFFVMTIHGSYLPCVFRRSQNFVVLAFILCDDSHWVIPALCTAPIQALHGSCRVLECELHYDMYT
jgi:hypothetical protein